MKILADQGHQAHWGKEFSGAEIVESWEHPGRADSVDEELAARGFSDHAEPSAAPNELLTGLHSQRYVHFLDTAWDRWVAAGRAETGSAMGFCWPTPGMGRTRLAVDADLDDYAIDALLGYFSFAPDCAITAGTASAARSAASLAYSAALLVADDPSTPAFARCRPPGHHAMAEAFGGYCYLNNAAIATQTLLDGGAGRVAVLDIDYHHGNGTQEIFYGRSDVLFASVHADPVADFPYFSGFADETGEGAGIGHNLNLPLPWGTGFERWSDALETMLAAAVDADAFVVSLGVDTFTDDPISKFTFGSDDFLTLGQRLARAGKPTVFVMEGGYATAEIGLNLVNVLDGFANP